MDYDGNDADVRPIRFREQVRAKGPTIALTGSGR